MKKKILVITPVKHIDGVKDILENTGEVTYLEDPSHDDVKKVIDKYHAVFTNPNKSKVYISKEIIDRGQNLLAICTASTGITHIDIPYAVKKGIKIISLTEEYDVIKKISSTAELAFTLMMSALRKIPQSFDSVKKGKWDYQPFIGRQLDHLTVGIVGYGRLGSLMAKYCKAFGSKVIVCDPYKDAAIDGYIQVELYELLGKSDIISIHVHVNQETLKMVDSSWFEKMKDSLILVNTSRGELIDEKALIKYLKTHPNSIYATDVICDEIVNKASNLIIQYAKKHKNIIITPHIGGMTIEGQQIAYRHAAKKLQLFFEDRENV